MSIKFSEFQLSKLVSKIVKNGSGTCSRSLWQERRSVRFPNLVPRVGVLHIPARTIWERYHHTNFTFSLTNPFQALKFFDQAITKTPHDRRALMGRAWARSKACKYEGALNDIRTALELDPDDLVMLAHKALNTYLNCEFEDGLVQNTRLIPKRKKPDYFQMGAMHVSPRHD